MARAVIRIARLAWPAAQERSAGERLIAEEAAVALTYNGGSYAVMMATPRDLKDFALGFSLTEGIVSTADDIRQIEIIERDIGIELRLWLSERRAAALNERRRRMAGPTGCGLCGIESLAEAMRPAPCVRTGQIFEPAEIMHALAALAPRQALNRQTRAVHAAGFWQKDTGLIAVREDVGRHNALDKLGGALMRQRVSTATGMVLVTSRVSVEMVQKTAALGVPVIIAISAPTALAVRTAEAAGITLVAIARDDGFEIFSHPYRIVAQNAIRLIEDVA
jgi:FdhD protein